MPATRSVLIVEDDPFIAFELQTYSEDLGYHVIGPCQSVLAGLAALKFECPQLALLDVELMDGKSFPIASRLQELQTPFAFVTGNVSLVRGAGFDSDIIQKPYSEHRIKTAIETMAR